MPLYFSTWQSLWRMVPGDYNEISQVVDMTEVTSWAGILEEWLQCHLGVTLIIINHLTLYRHNDEHLQISTIFIINAIITTITIIITIIITIKLMFNLTINTTIKSS
ncbi:hypothetical protein PoB_003917200 [Plakobranchus ocellatus]|uniref:Uncharacterized protein n=1 Tax=Plakobranchus ocellatus TaxID=259542 RepID=A0AAV4AZG3_9GAST|nr:hypothetical protein PoB_003917200 [Plakobranchus ocellatus]